MPIQNASTLLAITKVSTWFKGGPFNWLHWNWNLILAFILLNWANLSNDDCFQINEPQTGIDIKEKLDSSGFRPRFCGELLLSHITGNRNLPQKLVGIPVPRGAEVDNKLNPYWHNSSTRANRDVIGSRRLMGREYCHTWACCVVPGSQPARGSSACHGQTLRFAEATIR